MRHPFRSKRSAHAVQFDGKVYRNHPEWTFYRRQRFLTSTSFKPMTNITPSNYSQASPLRSPNLRGNSATDFQQDRGIERPSEKWYRRNHSNRNMLSEITQQNPFRQPPGYTSQHVCRLGTSTDAAFNTTSASFSSPTSNPLRPQQSWESRFV
jgi:hypothetical protein